MRIASKRGDRPGLLLKISVKRGSGFAIMSHRIGNVHLRHNTPKLGLMGQVASGTVGRGGSIDGQRPSCR
jgi:hypothetical protein